MAATAKSALMEQTTHRRDSEYARRGRYFDSGKAFAIKHPPVPRHVFLAERDRAFAPDTPTGLIALNLSPALELDFPATTPLILARYARIRAGETLETSFRASGEVFYAIRGRGRTECGNDRIEWAAGDTVFLPGGAAARHTASDDAVLWVVTDEPQLAFLGVAAPVPEESRAPVHFLAEDLDAQLDALYRQPGAENLPGLSIVYSSDAMEHTRNVHPVMTLAMNSLPPGKSQRPHHHNSVAVTLCVQGEGCHSVTDGERIDWSRYATFVTPPAETHSHYNNGTAQARFLIVQDGGFYYHCRTMGFAYDT